MKLKFGKWRFRHLGGRLFIINNLSIVKVIRDDSTDLHMEYIGTPPFRMPKEFEKEFLDEVKANYPNGLPEDGFIS